MFTQLHEYIQSVYRRDPAARSTWEVLTTYPGVHALAFHRLAHAIWCWRLRWIARLVSHLARWLTGIEIHPGATIGRRFFIDHGMGVVIGETAKIGDDCTLYHGVTLGGMSWKNEKRHPSLGNNVIVGAGAKILGPIAVGDNARIGSNSVVVRDVPADATVVGIPGRVVTPRRTDAKSKQREEFAKRVGFDAYGQTQHMPDPIAHAIDLMLDHMHQMEEKMAILAQALKKAGIEADLNLPHLELNNLENPIADDDKSPDSSDPRNS